MRRIARTLSVLLASSAAAGCQTTRPAALAGLTSRPEAPSPGGSDYTYGSGRALQTFSQSPAAVQTAVLGALEDLRVVAIRQISDAGTLTFEGTTADDRKASVTLTPNAGGSRLVARIGLFGDPALSRALMDRVGIRLGTLPATAIPASPPSDPSPNPYFSRAAISDAEMLREQAEAPYRSTAVPDNKPY